MIARLFPLILCLACCGCHTMSWEERRDREERYNTAEALKLHPLGLSRDEILARYPSTNSFSAGRVLSSVVRPDSGWPESRSYKYDENFFALRREHKAGTEIQSCVVVELPRGGSLSWIPNPTPGIWWDYLLFDKVAHLISVHRRFID
jgi:hypothetical protein